MICSILTDVIYSIYLFVVVLFFRIHDEISEWKREMENTIDYKDKKSDLIQKEKDLAMQQVTL
jgi:hypothetical protein